MRVADWTMRQLYRLAYPVYCFCRRFWRFDAVIMIVWVDDRILAVRHSYRPGLTVPGGNIKRREHPSAAAARELFEEVGIRVQPADLILAAILGPNRAGSYAYVLAAFLPDEPAIRIDRREIVFARFCNPSELRKGEQALVEMTRDALNLVKS